jgi:hypothetical protein
MDPLQFGVNGDVVAEALGLVIVLTPVMARALAPQSGWRFFLERTADEGIKEPIAYGSR